MKKVGQTLKTAGQTRTTPTPTRRGKRVALIDSGGWLDKRAWATGEDSEDNYDHYSRLLGTLEAAALKGNVQLSGISYGASPPTPLPEDPRPKMDEPEHLQLKRNQRRRKKEKPRVLQTAANWQIPYYDTPEDFYEANEAANEHKRVDAVCIVMRPSKERNELITKAAENAATVLVYPPAFTNTKELEDAIGALQQIERQGQTDALARVHLWVPHRYARGVQAARIRLEERHLRIADVSLDIFAGLSDSNYFISEFCLKFLDVMLCFAGGDLESVQLRRGKPEGKPTWRFTANHDKGQYDFQTAGGGFLSTAGGSFENIDHGRLVLATTGQERIELSRDMTEITHRTAQFHEQSDTSHDPQGHERNGSFALLEGSLTKRWPKRPETSAEIIKQPTLPNFRETQKLIDVLLAGTEIEVDDTRLETFRVEPFIKKQFGRKT